MLARTVYKSRFSIPSRFVSTLPKGSPDVIHAKFNFNSVWSEAFSRLQVDPYVSEGFRRKSIAFLSVVKGGTWTRLSHAPLVQPGKFNPVHGDLVRQYPPIPDNILQSQTFAELCRRYERVFPDLEDGGCILFQLQRISCSSSLTGLPVVEGHHRDGGKHLAVAVVARNNVAGGVSVFSKNKGEGVVFENVLDPGSVAFFRDDSLWHYASPIYPENPDKDGYRDIIILGCGHCRGDPSLSIYKNPEPSFKVHLGSKYIVREDLSRVENSVYSVRKEKLINE